MAQSLYAQLGAICYAAWGAFHVYVAWQIYVVALPLSGIAQGRMLQLAAYMLTIALFAIVIAVWRVWRNDRLGYWLNLGVVGCWWSCCPATCRWDAASSRRRSSCSGRF